MQNISKSAIIFFLSIFTANLAQSQISADTAKVKINDKRIMLPDFGIMGTPEQIGFGKLKIDTTDHKQMPYTIKQRIIDSAFRSVTLYMALHEKEFKAWEAANYRKATPMNLDFDMSGFPTTGGRGGISILAILRLFFGKDFLVDRWVMEPKERLKFEEEWRRWERAERERKLQGKYEENEEKDEEINEK